MGGGRHGWQSRDVTELCALCLRARAEIEHGGDQNHAVERDIIIAPFQLVDHGCRSRGAIALPAQKFGAVPTAIVAQPFADHLGDGARILGHAPIVTALRLTDQMREAGAHRIDKDKVGYIEQRIRIIQDRVRRGAVITRIGRNGDPLGAKGAHLQPDGARARPAIEQEGDRPRCVIRLSDIRRHHNRRGRFVILIFQHGFGYGGGVRHARAAKGTRKPARGGVGDIIDLLFGIGLVAPRILR